MLERRAVPPQTNDIRERRCKTKELLNFKIVAAPEVIKKENKKKSAIETKPTQLTQDAPNMDGATEPKKDAQDKETVIFEKSKEESTLKAFFGEMLLEFVSGEYGEHEEVEVAKPKKDKSRFKKLDPIAQALKPGVIALAKKLMARVETNIGAPIQPEYAPGFNEALIEAAKDPNNVLVFVCNHEGLGDGAPSGIISKQTTDLINSNLSPGQEKWRGWMLTIASSLASGHQGSLWQELVKLGDETLQKYSLFMKPFTREKDKVKYNLYADNDEYKETLDSIVQKKPDRIADGLMLYIAGNMEEGRRVKRKFPGNLYPFGRHIKGLQDLNCDRFHALAKISEIRYKKNFIVIPVGAYGGFNVFDPEHHSMPTPKTIKELISNHPNSLFQVKVGLPMPYDQIVLRARMKAENDFARGQRETKDITSRDVDFQIGLLLTANLPQDAHGFYKGKA